MKTETDHPNTGKGRDESEENSGNGEYLRQSSKTKEKLGRLDRPLRPGAGNVFCTIVFNSRRRKKAERKGRDNKEKEARKQRKRKRGKGNNETEGRTSKERDSMKARKQQKKEKTRIRKQ